MKRGKAEGSACGSCAAAASVQHRARALPAAPLLRPGTERRFLGTDGGIWGRLSGEPGCWGCLKGC